MGNGDNPWRGGALVLAVLIALVWFAPYTDVPQTARARLVLDAANAVVTPLIDLVGKTPILVLLGAATAYCLLRSFGIRLRGPGRGVARQRELSRAEAPLPQQPSVAPVPDGPRSFGRRRGPAQLSVARDGAPGAPMAPRAAAAPPTDFEAELEAEYLAAAAGSRSATRETLQQHYENLHGPGSVMNDEVFKRASTLADRWMAQLAPLEGMLDPIVLVRKPRDKARDWRSDPSWFGGLPRLGAAAWPRGADGVPLPFVAQIDLAEIAAVHPETPLPKQGSLAFFLNGGAVIHVPAGATEPTQPPQGLPPAFEAGSHPLPQRPSRAARPLFPFWPVELVRLRLPEGLPTPDEDIGEIHRAQNEALKGLVKQRSTGFLIGVAQDEGVAGVGKLWWHGAQHVLLRLEDALDGAEDAVARHEKWVGEAQADQARLAADPQQLEHARAREARHRAMIPEARQQEAGLRDFIAGFEGFVAGNEPWTEMSGDDIETLERLMAEAHNRFPELCRFTVPQYLDDLRMLCLRAMITGEDAAAQAIPDDLLAIMNERYRLPPEEPHQMFGLAGCKQTALEDHLDDHLLLQIAYDTMPEFRFGDMGLWQFWISPADLAAGRFDRVELTFEGA